MENKPEKNILLTLLKNKITFNGFMNYINKRSMINNQISIIFLTFFLLIASTAIFTVMAAENYLSLSKYIYLLYTLLGLFSLAEIGLFYSVRKRKLFYYSLLDKKIIKKIKRMKDDKSIKEFLLKNLTNKDFNDNIDDVIDYLDKDINFCLNYIKVDFDNENVINSKYIKDIILFNSKDKKSSIIYFLENEEKFKKYLSYISFKKLKYEIISESINDYINNENNSYIEEIIKYIDEVNLNNKEVYLLKEMCKTKNVSNNIMSDLNSNSNMVYSF